MSRLNYVLRSAPTELNFIDSLFDAFHFIKQQHGLELKYAFFEEGADDLARHVYQDTKKQIILSVVEDLTTPIRYLTIEAATRQEVERLGKWIIDLLPIISLEELQEETRQRMVDDPQTLFRMAIGADEVADPTSLEILRQGLQSEDDLVRFRAAAAASITQWRELLSDVELLSQNDPSPEVREIASLAVQAC